jgi:hypothetical protein
MDGFDFPASTNDPTHKKLSEARIINGGKYFHFIIENALKRKSIGLIHREADLLQFVDVYLQNPGILQKILRDRVSDHFNYVHAGLYFELQHRKLAVHVCIV